MEMRLKDFFLGLALGYYCTPTIVLFGVTVPWVLVGLVLSYLIPLFRKLGRFLWNKFIEAVKNELMQQNS